MFSAILLVAILQAGAPLPTTTDSVVFDKTANEFYETAIAEFQRLQIGPRVVAAEQAVEDDRLLRDVWTVFAVVVEGNGARIQPLTKLESAVTLFPRLAQHKGLAKSFVLLAQSEYESGDSRGATTILAETIKYGQNLTRMGAMLHQAMGVALQQIALKPLWVHRDEISERAASTLHSVAQRGLDFDHARWTIDAVLAESVLRSKSLKDFFAPVGFGTAAEAESEMTPKEATEFLEEYADESVRLHGLLVPVLSRPEAQWKQRSKVMLNFHHDVDEFSGKLFAAMDWGVVPTYLHMVVKHRTRLRLLKVMANLALYRANHGQFPSSLDVLGKTKDVTDPLTGRSFAYDITADGYELFSAGYGETGRIYLWERRDVEVTDPPLS